MGTISSRLLLGISKIFQKAGTQISVTYYLPTIGSGYDEETSLTASGNVIWTSGIVFPLDPNSTTDAVLVEQGKLVTGDLKLYTHGSLILSINSANTTGSTLYTKIGVGSPGTHYSMIPLGGVPYEVEGIKVFKRAYIRQLVGSLVGT